MLTCVVAPATTLCVVERCRDVAKCQNVHGSLLVLLNHTEEGVTAWLLGTRLAAPYMR